MWTAILLVVTGFLAPNGPPTLLCSVRGFPEYRHSSMTVILGRATGETVAPPAVPRDTANGAGHWPGPGTHLAYRFRVDRLDGAHREAVAARWASGADSTVWVVPWDRDPSCRPVPWRRGGAWAPTDRAGVLTVVLREPADWYDGQPTFDAFGADRQAYPHGIFYRLGNHRQATNHVGPALSAEEFFSLLVALPTESAGRSRGTGLPPELQRWVEDNPSLINHLPAAQILNAWRRRP